MLFNKESHKLRKHSVLAYETRNILGLQSALFDKPIQQICEQAAASGQTGAQDAFHDVVDHVLRQTIANVVQDLRDEAIGAQGIVDRLGQSIEDLAAAVLLK